MIALRRVCDGTDIDTEIDGQPLVLHSPDPELSEADAQAIVDGYVANIVVPIVLQITAEDGTVV